MLYFNITDYIIFDYDYKKIKVKYNKKIIF